MKYVVSRIEGKVGIIELHNPPHQFMTTQMVRELDELTERGFVNAFAGVALPNDASVGLFESLGFKRVAFQEKVGFKLGAWLDVGWWQKFLRPHDVPPPEIAPA